MSDFKPGDIVQHPEKDYGIVVQCLAGLGVTYSGPYGYRCVSEDLDGWEKVDVLPAGHVAVRVDDLEDDDVAQGSAHRASNRLLDAYYAWKDAQRPEEPVLPEEPMEIGAKFTDAEGEQWFRTGADTCPWVRLRDGEDFNWRDVIGWDDDE